VNKLDVLKNEAGSFDSYRHIFDLAKKLDRTSHFLRVLGILALFATLCNLGVLVGQAIDSALVARNNQLGAAGAVANGYTFYREYLSYWWLVGVSAVFVAALIILGTFDLLRRRGDAIFQEVSNGFQELESDSPSKSREVRGELIRQAGASLRSFASAEDPLLIRSRFGIGIYAITNIAIVLIAVILYSQAA
jgi:hypothetical protein